MLAARKKMALLSRCANSRLTSRPKMRESIRSTFTALAVSLLCVAAAAPASSEVVVQDGGGVSEARLHFAKGLALFGSAEYGGARAEIERAYAIAPSYRLLYDLALCCNGQGDRIAAHAYLQQYLDEGAAEIEPARRREAEDLLAHLRAQLATVKLRTNVTGDVAVVVDDQPRGALSEKPLVLLPGTRTIWVTKRGYYPASQVIALNGGDAREVAFALRELPRVVEASQPWWRHARVRWSAFAAFVFLVALVAVTWRRKKRTQNVAVVQLNPYQVDAAKVSEPTPQHHERAPRRSRAVGSRRRRATGSPRRRGDRHWAGKTVERG